MKKFLTIVFAAMLVGCAEMPSVQEANDADAINTVSMSCNSPYPLEQDCSIWSGATRNISPGGFEVKVAASADGKVILVMDSKLFSNLLLGGSTHSKASNDSFHAVKKTLDSAGIKINRVRTLRSFGNVDGYILELDSDGYSLLKKPSYAAVDEHAIVIKKTNSLVYGREAQEVGDLQQYSGMKDQFELALPKGWSVYDQGMVLSSKPSKTGLPVVFCSEPIDGKAMLSGDRRAVEKVADQLASVETGALAGFILDRLPAKQGMSCHGFDATAQKMLLDLMGTEPMFGPGRITRGKPHAEPLVIGGCQGLRIKGKGTARTGDGRSLDVFAVSDGETLFLFKLENLDEHYPKNIDTFERIMSTLRLTATPTAGE